MKLFNKSVVLGFSLGTPPFVGMRRQLGCRVGRAPLGGALVRDEVRLRRVRRHHCTPEVKCYE
jgi:hypothetical protein